MLEKFRKNIARLGIPENARMMVAVSGGIDSMLLLHLLVETGFKPIVAHCNFGLRGKDSDMDQQLVEKMSKKYKLEVFVKKFSTLSESKIRKTGIQETARSLRYDWFHEMTDEMRIDYIFTAHHGDDQVETFMINLMRGSGLQGLCGIPEVNGKIVRPLLFATRKEIEHYATSQKLSFREDLSNADTKYLRNKVRHKLLPTLEEIRPGSVSKVLDTMRLLNEAHDFLTFHLQHEAKDLLIVGQNEIKIDRKKLQNSVYRHLILYSILQPLGFADDTVRRLSDTVRFQTGRKFFSDSHVIFVEKQFYVVNPLAEKQKTMLEIKGAGTYSLPAGILKVSQVSERGLWDVENKSILYVDNSVVTFPLSLRLWESGDKFRPFGLKGTQNVSNILTNAGITGTERKAATVLISSNEIIWLCGVRSAEKLRVETWSENIWKFEIIKAE
ncbi:MAG: tRNA lysidine(34) synthetase TilS [Bacteroidetes bacterium HGW-Bacteroidetes-21]|jgi:tRNA(Ile)-lysidine synthase|nr:MAG: tRNA lysidine(34) synthetase TilS [Bacteroidetes bacterium HGW-Bacteroidetes-21]